MQTAKEIFGDRLTQIESILSQALPEQINKEWKSQSFGILPDSVTEEHLQELTHPCRHLFTSGGKRWRPLLLILCAEATAQRTKRSCDVAYQVTPLVEFTHTASLIHDDIEDCADTRRGKPAAHITYGIDRALNAASWLYFEAGACINALPISDEEKVRLYALYTNELRRLHLGQAMDIRWHRTPALIPSIEEYYAMVRSKTGTLASLAAQAGVLVAGGTQEDAVQAGTLAAEIGIGFQILDDVQNLTTGNPGKKRGDDIVEGKKSLPLLLHIQSQPQDKERLIADMQQAHNEGIDSPAVDHCITIMEQSDAITKAFNTGKDFVTTRSEILSKTLGADNDLIQTLFLSMLPSLS
ncbi:MAG: polyprenyl synthetase family protein [Treponema sp.]|nr:polyprenyl synthetase family protein [Treponema sp.]